MSDITRHVSRYGIPAFREDMDDLFSWARDFQHSVRNRGMWFPIDVVETADDYMLTAEIAGVDRDAVEIDLDRNVLTVRVVKPKPDVAEGSSYHVQERSHGEFSRSVHLPESIDPDRVSASYANGVLDIRVAKAEESKPRKIDISQG